MAGKFNALDRNRLGAVGIALAIVLFFAINIAAGALLTSSRLDLTADRLFTLSDGTRQVLSNIQEPVDLRTIVAGAVIVGAVALIVTARGRMRAPTADHGGRAVEVSPPRPPSEPRAEPAPSRSASG